MLPKSSNTDHLSWAHQSQLCPWSKSWPEEITESLCDVLGGKSIASSVRSVAGVASDVPAKRRTVRAAPRLRGNAIDSWPKGRSLDKAASLTSDGIKRVCADPVTSFQN